MVVDGIDEQALEPAIVPDGHSVGALLRRAREHHHPVADGVDRRTVGVVELDALMLLEVASHGRAVAVRLVDVRLIGGENGALEPAVPHPLQIGVGSLLVRDADEGESLVEATGDEPRRPPHSVPPGRERQEAGGRGHGVAHVERAAVLLVHALARGGVHPPRCNATERLDRRHVLAAALHHRAEAARRAPLAVEPGVARRVEPVQSPLGPHPHDRAAVGREGADATRCGILRPGAPTIRGARQPAQVTRPHTPVQPGDQRQHVLAAQAPP